MKLKLGNESFSIIVANTFLLRLKGLIGRKNIDFGMIFPECNSIHTFGMLEPIDIVGLDSQNKVIYLYRNLSKNRMIQIKNPIKNTSILELPHHASKDIKLGDTLFFEVEDVI